MSSKSGLPIKIMLREVDPYFVFEVEYLWNGWVKKDGINDNNLIQYDYPLFRYTTIEFAFSPCLILSGEAKITLVLHHLIW